MLKFYATIEFLSGQSAAILTLTDQAGEWAGSGRIEGRDRASIYERAYTHASLSAQSKGGRLERFSRVEAPKPEPTWQEHSEACGSRVIPAFLHRGANALNVEPMQPTARCLNRKPEHWPESMSALRWRASGGDALVFGCCEAQHCPERKS
jgi:hypothetical protein